MPSAWSMAACGRGVWSGGGVFGSASGPGERDRAGRFNHGGSPQVAGGAVCRGSDSDDAPEGAGAGVLGGFALYAESCRGLFTRQRAHQHAVDAAHELAEAVAYVADSWAAGVRGAY